MNIQDKKETIENNLVRKEKCAKCSHGTVEFYKVIIDENDTIMGACDYCGYCCDDKLEKVAQTGQNRQQTGRRCEGWNIILRRDGLI